MSFMTVCFDCAVGFPMCAAINNVADQPFHATQMLKTTGARHVQHFLMLQEALHGRTLQSWCC